MEKKLLIDQNISNFDLLIAMKTIKSNPTMETQNDLINQLLHARLLCPANLDPEPELNEAGEIPAKETRIMFHTVSNGDDKVFLIAYTDKKEADKYLSEKNHHTIVTTYTDFCNIILSPNSPFAGFVLNPFEENIIFTKEIMLDINKNIRIINKTDGENGNPPAAH